MKLKYFLKLLDKDEYVEICYCDQDDYTLVNFGTVHKLKRMYAYHYFLKEREVLKVDIDVESKCFMIVVEK